MKYAYFIWKNLMRKKARTVLTVLSIVVAFILFGMLSALSNAFEAGADVADRLVTIHKISLINPLPISYVHRVEQIDGVKSVTHATWFGGYYQEPRNTFAQFPVDAESYLEVYDDLELPAGQKQAWLKNRGGAVIGESLAERFGWEVGDRVPLITTIYTRNGGERTWEFDIEGIFTSSDSRTDTSYMLFHYDYFDEARDFGQGTVGWLVFTIDEAENAASIAETIDTTFANSPAQTKTSTEKAFAESFSKQFGDIGLITKLILAAVFFTMLLVTGNTMAQSVRERIPELAVLKTMGFTDANMLIWVLGESVALALIGAVVALTLDYVLIGIIATAVSAYLPGLALPPSVMFEGLGLAVLFGVLAGLFPAVQAMRLNIVNALGRH